MTMLDHGSAILTNSTRIINMKSIILDIKLLLIISTSILLSIDIVKCKISDFRLINKYGREIHDRQAEITIEELIFKLHQVKDSVSRLTHDIPLKFPPGLDRGLILNAIALTRLTDVNCEKCYYQPNSDDYNDNNVHRSNYIELATVTTKIYTSKNMRNHIKQYFDAQNYLCLHHLPIHVGQQWTKILVTHREAAKFSQSMIANFPINKSLAEFKPDVIIYGILTLIRDCYKVHYIIGYEKVVIDIYNGFFRTACEVYVLNPFHTLMMTYRKSGNYRNILDVYQPEIVRMYELCSRLPDKIDDVKSIGILGQIVEKKVQPVKLFRDYSEVVIAKRESKKSNKD